MSARLVAAALALSLSACGGTVSGSTPHQLLKSFTPGLVVRCRGRCVIYPANVDDAPAPGERAVPDHP